jgi:hypothetical protein
VLVPSSIGLVNAAGLPKRYQEEIGSLPVLPNCRSRPVKGQTVRPSPPPLLPSATTIPSAASTAVPCSTPDR